VNVSARTEASSGSAPDDEMVLVGREDELAKLQALLDDVGAGGASLVIHGDPGIGKSALVDEFGRLARARSVNVVRTVGVPAEQGIAFAGLHRLLRPYLARTDRLPEPQRKALDAAFGRSGANANDLFLVALAALELLADATEGSPLLIVAEDAHSLDPDTVQALGFIGRRIELDPILLLITSRDLRAVPSAIADLPSLHLDSLNTAESARLINLVTPSISESARARVLEASAGNPLALMEFARAAVRGEDLSPLAPLPMTERLTHTFADLLPTLPPPTIDLLLVTALDEGGRSAEQVAAASKLAGRGLSDDDLAPAVEAGLVTREGIGRFRHPLIRAAVVSVATASACRAAHAALAEVYDRAPDRALKHCAAAAAGPDDQLALELEQAGIRAISRGASAVAAAAFERASELATKPMVRGRLLVRAAEMESDIGRHEAARRLLNQATALPLSEQTRAHLTFIGEASRADIWSGPDRVAAAADAARELASVAPSLAPRALMTAATACWWGRARKETRDLVVTTAKELPLANGDPQLLPILAFADPAGEAAAVTAGIARIRPYQLDPEELLHIGRSTIAVWQFDQGLPFLTAAVEGLRARGRARLLAQALASQSWAAFHLARETLAVEAADEGARLARDTGQPMWATVAELAQASLAGERGDFDTANALAERAEAELLPNGPHTMLALVQFARGRGAVAHQMYSDGYEQLRRALCVTDIAYHPFLGAWGLSDLIESAVNVGREDEAQEYLLTLESLAEQSQASFLRAILAYAKPILAPNGEAENLFQAAISEGLTDWPCYRGRLLLNYGRWLRRQRRIGESRAPLRAARETFDALAFHGLAETARRELRASGETSGQRIPDARDSLSPNELQIAEMAAAGLSNRKIGQRLFVSHRTVESHLYRIYRKLGVTSRVQISAALPHAATPIQDWQH
jgi:DNA-binding CsgD family transcriptional regulator